MFKVLLVDDEPFVTKALKVLINWEELGYVVCAEASDGQSAVELIVEHKPHLVISDIRMPRMDGLNLAKYCSDVMKYNCKFIILSGYKDFSYAQEAMRCGVKDYLLKPVDEDELIDKLKTLYEEISRDLKRQLVEEEADMLRINKHIEQLLRGYDDGSAVEKVNSFFKLEERIELRYVIIHIISNYKNQLEEAENKEKIKVLTQQLEANCGFHIFNYSSNNIEGIIKFTFSDGEGTAEIVSDIKKVIYEDYGFDCLIFVGGAASEAASLKQSAEQAKSIMLHKFFNNRGSIIFYDDIEDINFDYSFEKVLDIDALIDAIEKIDNDKINELINEIFNQFYNNLYAIEVINTYINNLVIEIMKLIKEVGGEVDSFVKEHSLFTYSIMELTLEELKINTLKLCLKSASYIKELRVENSKGVISEVEKYIRNHYMEDINLKSIAEKFFMNSVYLGQQFKKCYGVHFNDYLNGIRIKEAQKLLSRTNKRIYEIAECVGYKNTDYFVGRFQKLIGMSPSEYKKSVSNIND
jgi:two-component system, response regulator YesN